MIADSAPGVDRVTRKTTKQTWSTSCGSCMSEPAAQESVSPPAPYLPGAQHGDLAPRLCPGNALNAAGLIQLWQMDFKGRLALLANLRCHPLTALDDHSRFAAVLKACATNPARPATAARRIVLCRHAQGRRSHLSATFPRCLHQTGFAFRQGFTQARPGPLVIPRGTASLPSAYKRGCATILVPYRPR